MEDQSYSIICLINFYIKNHSMMPIRYNLQIITPRTDYHIIVCYVPSFSHEEQSD
uniref:Uncharacterized protein n=1 Tax=Arundo donax TaxID=35708 RepID=A0A0A9I1G4_ARUDO